MSLSYKGKRVDCIGVYRTDEDGPIANSNIHGQMYIENMTVGMLMDMIELGDAVMRCYGAPEEFSYCVRTKGTQAWLKLENPNELSATKEDYT